MKFSSFRRSNWFIPVASGVLILFSLALKHWLGFLNSALFPGWWIIFGSDHHAQGESFLASDLVMLGAAVVAGYGISVKAVRSLRVKYLSIDLLVTVAAFGAILIGNFWEAAAVTFLFSIGHALEAATMNKTRNAIAKLVEIAPDDATVLRDGEQIVIPAGRVRVGETVIVKNGSKVPVDGEVISGSAAIDESAITGESIPVQKSEADRVFAGTISHGGLLEVVATGVGRDTTLARIIHRVEEAQDSKAKTQAFIDRFSKWYTPAVFVLAIVAWAVSGNLALGLTLLVIGCPGALVISIPVAIVAGIGRSARDGILIKGGEYLETAAKISAVAIDKTGTLTEGEPKLTDIVSIKPGFDKDDVLKFAAAAETGSEHHLAKPILETARGRGVASYQLPEDVQYIAGKGVIATADGERVLIGNAMLMHEHGVSGLDAAVPIINDFGSSGKTAVAVSVGNEIVGILAVADTIRQDAKETVAMLRANGIKKIVMLTGDTEPVAQAIADEAGIGEVYASMLPEEKLEKVAELQKAGYTVAMVGDGVNDAPALAAADIGVAMGAAGTAVAVETADIALMADNLLKLPAAISYARRTVNVMRQNIIIALATVLLLLAGVFMGEVTMALGMLVHEGSILVVILNAMRLLRKPTKSLVQEREFTVAKERV